MTKTGPTRELRALARAAAGREARLAHLTVRLTEQGLANLHRLARELDVPPRRLARVLLERTMEELLR